MQTEIEKRANQLAKYWRNIEPTEKEDSTYLMAELIEDELTREGLSFEAKLEVIKRSISLIEKQPPKTKKERLEAILSNEPYFSKQGINVSSGQEETYWGKYDLERACEEEGIPLQEFIDWKIHNKKVN
ncbi:hypothetical protein [Enterococcus sp. DIV0800]|uniref:hypothetical protein n=1 Tax=unclassified Enterococcus TaxID=2608891 RepID=UPI003D2FD23B